MNCTRRKVNRLHGFAPAALFGAFLAAVAQASWAQNYRVYDLGPNTAALHISANKTVSGQIGTAGGIWTYVSASDAFKPQILGNPFRSEWCQGYGVNDAGQVAATASSWGLYINEPTWESAFRYSAGKWSALTGKTTQSEAMAINSLGHVAGTSTSNTGFKATIWQGTKQYALPGIGTDGYAMAINDSGTVAGYTAYPWRPFVWKPATPNGIKGGLVDFPLMSGRALGIHNNGDVVGDELIEVSPGVLVRQAFYWAAGTSAVTRIGTLYKGLSGESLGSSSARAVNSSGKVVGISEIDAAYTSHAFVWDRDTGQLTDLNALLGSQFGPTFTEMTRAWMIVDVPEISINDSGWICMTVRFQDNSTRGIILSPVPSGP